MDKFEPPKYIASLTAAINDGAKSAQAGAFGLALIGLYLLATAFSATDEDLLLDRPGPRPKRHASRQRRASRSSRTGIRLNRVQTRLSIKPMA